MQRRALIAALGTEGFRAYEEAEHTEDVRGFVDGFAVQTALPPASTLSENLNAVSNASRDSIHRAQLRYILYH